MVIPQVLTEGEESVEKKVHIHVYFTASKFQAISKRQRNHGSFNLQNQSGTQRHFIRSMWTMHTVPLKCKLPLLTRRVSFLLRSVSFLLRITEAFSLEYIIHVLLAKR